MASKNEGVSVKLCVALSTYNTRWSDGTKSTVPTNTDHNADVSVIIETVMKCYVINIVSVLGIMGNVFNIVVLRKHGMKDSTNILLLSMSVMDLAYLLVTPIRRSHCFVAKSDPAMAITLTAIDRVFLAVPNRIVGIISSSHIVLISVERVVAVYFPFKVAMIFSTFNTKIYLAVMYAFWIVQCAPFLFLFTYTWTFDPVYKQTVGSASYSNFFKDNFDIINIYNSMVISNIRGPISVIVVLLCSIFIGIRLHHANRKRARISTKKSGVDFRVVRMLLVVSMVYLSIGLPVHMAFMYFYIYPQAMSDGSKTSALYNLLNTYVNDLYTINASVNFLIYVTMSQKFRNTCKAVIRSLVFKKIQ